MLEGCVFGDTGSRIGERTNMVSLMKGEMLARKELVVVWAGMKFECQGLKYNYT